MATRSSITNDAYMMQLTVRERTTARESWIRRLARFLFG